VWLVGSATLVACGADATPGGLPTPTAAGGSVPVDPTAPVAAPTTAATVATAPVATAVSIPPSIPVASPSCPPPADDTSSTAPASVTASLQGAAADRRFTNETLSVSVWIDGWGEVLAVHPDQALVPASNQKLLVAAAVVSSVDLQSHPRTAVVATGPVRDGVVQGDLVLVGGGDPDLTSTGPRSIDALAAAVHDAGVVGATGGAVVDETRYDDERTVSSWPPGTVSLANAGGLGALVIDRNRGPLDDIGASHQRAFVAALLAHSITAAGPARAATAPTVGVEVAGIDGPSYGDLVTQMLQLSDGLVAESLVKEVGRRQAGAGSTAGGLGGIRQLLAPLCVPMAGTDVDGSGFSYGDSRSAREWRRLLHAIGAQQWGSGLFERLPVAGTSGTLATRLSGAATKGNVRAKTGSLSTAQSMSGELTTAGGRHATFSIVVNGPRANDLAPAIDSLVTAIASLPG
jgi:D-alanyl-D-alanine carboxypeptidase/D-alanyl-D-alanine-endopeptidase (penicillin-binding protein 4)